MPYKGYDLHNILWSVWLLVLLCLRLPRLSFFFFAVQHFPAEPGTVTLVSCSKPFFLLVWALSQSTALHLVLLLRLTSSCSCETAPCAKVGCLPKHLLFWLVELSKCYQLHSLKVCGCRCPAWIKSAITISYGMRLFVLKRQSHSNYTMCNIYGKGSSNW